MTELPALPAASAIGVERKDDGTRYFWHSRLDAWAEGWAILTFFWSAAMFLGIPPVALLVLLQDSETAFMGIAMLAISPFLGLSAYCFYRMAFPLPEVLVLRKDSLEHVEGTSPPPPHRGMPSIVREATEDLPGSHGPGRIYARIRERGHKAERRSSSQQTGSLGLRIEPVAWGGNLLNVLKRRRVTRLSRHEVNEVRLFGGKSGKRCLAAKHRTGSLQIAHSLRDVDREWMWEVLRRWRGGETGPESRENHEPEP